MAPVRLLLVNPRYPESFWSFRWAVDSILPGKRAINPPLGLATLAALCPPDWEVDARLRRAARRAAAGCRGGVKAAGIRASRRPPARRPA